MGNSIKKNIISLFISLLLTSYFLLLFSSINFLENKDSRLFSSFFILLVIFFLLVKKIISFLSYILFTLIMPIITLIIIIYIDASFFDKQIIDNLLKLFSWNFYEGETRSRYVTKVLFNFLLPLLLFLYGIIAFCIYHFKKSYIRKQKST